MIIKQIIQLEFMAIYYENIAVRRTMEIFMNTTQRSQIRFWHSNSESLMSSAEVQCRRSLAEKAKHKDALYLPREV